MGQLVKRNKILWGGLLLIISGIITSIWLLRPPGDAVTLAVQETKEKAAMLDQLAAEPLKVKPKIRRLYQVSERRVKDVNDRLDKLAKKVQLMQSGLGTQTELAALEQNFSNLPEPSNLLAFSESGQGQATLQHKKTKRMNTLRWQQKMRANERETGLAKSEFEALLNQQ